MNELENRLGVCSWSLEPRDAASLIDNVKNLGLAKLQLAIDPIREQPSAWKALPGLLADHGIQLASGQFGAVGEDYASPQTIRATGGVVPDEHWPTNRENLEQTLPIARTYGLTTLTTHAGFIPPSADDPVFDKLVERVRHLADRIEAELGGRLLLETGQETAETLEQFLKALDRPQVGVNFDPANLLLYAMGDPVPSLARLRPYLGQVHIKDATPPATLGQWGEEVTVGEGNVDWVEFFKVLENTDYDGDLIIEREAGHQRVQDIKTARDFVLAHAVSSQ